MQPSGATIEHCSLPPFAATGKPELGSDVDSERKQEFEEVLSRALPHFRRMAGRWLRNPEDAEDAVQGALLSGTWQPSKGVLRCLPG